MSSSTAPLPAPPPAPEPLPLSGTCAPALEVRIRFDPRLPFVRLTGELDLASAHLVSDALDTVAATAYDAQMVVLDLAGLTFCDVAGLRCVEACGLTLEEAGLRLVLYQPPVRVMRLIASSGVAARLECR